MSGVISPRSLSIPPYWLAAIRTALPAILASITLVALAVSLPQPAQAARSGTSESTLHPYAKYQIALGEPGYLIVRGGADIATEKTDHDTFYVYGGPEGARNFADPSWGGQLKLEGRFQTSDAYPGGNPDSQGWVGVDLTEADPHWHASTTNASTLGGGSPGNHACIDHFHGPEYVGYGNNWDDLLVIEIDAMALGLDPATDTATVHWTCEFVHDIEPGWDFFDFGAKLGGGYVNLLRVDGSSYVDSTGVYEPVAFDSDLHGGIVYDPGDYEQGRFIVLRYRFTSDGAWSDEDGLWPSDGRGAVAVDDIEVLVNGNLVSDADWEHVPEKVGTHEGASGRLGRIDRADLLKDDTSYGDVSGHDNGAGLATAGWIPRPSRFAGEFSKLFMGFFDIDPCRENFTPQWGFVDDGTPPSNGLGQSTGGSVSSTWNYGVPGGWVVNYTGGLSLGENPLDNEIWSPEIEWDLPGSEDDVANGGAVLRFTRFTHLPLNDGIFTVWHVDSYRSDVGWSGWADNNFVYFTDSPAYGNFDIDISEHLLVDPERVRVALGVVDLAEVFSLDGNDATPAPMFDNVMVKKYVIGGPVMKTRHIDLARDGFPTDGSSTGSIRFDGSIETGPPRGALIPGDSIVVDIKAIIPGSGLLDPTKGGTLKVAHHLNPAYGDETAGARMAGLNDPRIKSLGFAATSPRGWKVYTYEVDGHQSTINGYPLEGRYFFDLPDGQAHPNAPSQGHEPGLIFPGDAIHYYIEAKDDQGNTGTLPLDVTGFTDFGHNTPYDRVFTMRALPGVDPSTDAPPTLLFWNDFGHRDAEVEYIAAFHQNHVYEGENFDTYTTKGPSSEVGNGLGAVASPAQLASYDHLVYACGDLGHGLISDGSDQGGNGKSNDVALLTAWHNQTADRTHAYFGDDFADGMRNQGGASQTYVNTIVGVDAISGNVRPIIDDQTTPMVVPTQVMSSYFRWDYIAYGGCLVINDFDHIEPFGAGPVVSHEFTTPFGSPYPSPVPASVAWDRMAADYRRATIAFAMDLSFVYNVQDSPPIPGSARTRLFGEVLNYLGIFIIINDNEPARRPFTVSRNYPNPFNPRTRISVYAPKPGDLSIKIYDPRGRLVRVIQDGRVEEGEQDFDWDGRDRGGARVASGVYLYRVEGFGRSETHKMALVR